MVTLPKFNIEGQVHFVTIKTFRNLKYFKDEKCCDIFLSVLDNLGKKLKFKLFGFVIMLDHIHLLLQPWVGSNSFEPSKNQEANEFASTLENISYVVKRIKGASAREINKYLKSSGNFWQKDFYDFNIYSEEKLREKLNYIHNNPVKHGLVKDPKDWKHSS